MKLHQNIEVMKELIEIISARSNVSVEVLEKDYYVTLILKELSEKENQGYAYFKGGTALYKALKSIRRFSEDIDLTVYVNDCSTNSQKQKRLKESVMNYIKTKTALKTVLVVTHDKSEAEALGSSVITLID